MDMNLSQLGRVEFIEAIGRNCGLLHQIVISYPLSQSERDAIELAAKALLFSTTKDEFQGWASSDELTQDQRERLKRLGIEDVSNDESSD